MCWHKENLTIYNYFYSERRTQKQITNHKSDNLHVLIGSVRVLPEIILKLKHLKYRSA